MSKSNKVDAVSWCVDLLVFWCFDLLMFCYFDLLMPWLLSGTILFDISQIFLLWQIHFNLLLFRENSYMSSNMYSGWHHVKDNWFKWVHQSQQTTSSRAVLSKNLSFKIIFSCPQQLNRWPCHSLSHSVTFTFDITEWP